MKTIAPCSTGAKRRSLKLFPTLSALLLGVAIQASAVSFDFYKLGRGVVNGDFLPDGTAGVDYHVIAGDNVSSRVDLNVFGGDLKFTIGGLTATATGSFNNGRAIVPASAVQDAEGSWSNTIGAGLGVYHVFPLDTSDDNITAGELLTITFNQVVRITNIGLRSEGHNFTNWNPNATFLLNGGSNLLPLNVGSINVDLVGSQFTFAYGGDEADQFYLSSLNAERVPEGGATAILLGLSTIGLGLFRKRFAKR